ncbi:MAG: prolyl oligopeptidase family serine peptidase [Acidobacteriaceae bacterium]
MVPDSSTAPPLAAKKFPDNADLRHVRAMGMPELSPDGRSVLVQIADATADGGKPHLWLVEMAVGNKPASDRQLTFSLPAPNNKEDKRGEFAGAWMPDGSSILFLAHRGEHTQLFRLRMDGGEAVAFDLKVLPPVDESKRAGAIPPAKVDAAAAKVPEAKEKPVEIDVAKYWIAPDGKTIALLARDPQTAGEKKEKDAKADAVWVDHDPHGTRLYLLDPVTSKLTVTAVPTNVAFAAWSPSSDRILAIAEAPNNAGDLGPARSAWLVDAKAPQHPARMDALPATIETAAWTVDAQSIAYLAQARQDAPPGYADLYTYQIATEQIEDRSADLQGSLSRGRLFSVGNGRVVASIEHGFHATAALFDVSGEGKSAIELLRFDSPVVNNFGTNWKRTGWVYIASSSTQPPTLCYTERLRTDGANSCTALPTPPMVPANWEAARSQTVHWKSGQHQIEGLIYLPPQAKQGKVPLIVEVHGGPLGAFHDNYSPWIQFLVGHGWGVFVSNPRGSSAYGASFAAANKNDLGGGDYRDIMRGVDMVLREYPLDASKMALIGYSYGGEMAGFVEGKTDRFRAIVSGAPVIDQYSEYGTESGSWYDRWYFGKPWLHSADAWRQSPLSGVARAKTPFLLLQGEGDTTDPLGQSKEMYRALRQDGVPVEMIEYPRDNHGPLAGNMFGMPSPEPWHGFDARQRTVEFIQKNFGTSGEVVPAKQ